MRNRNTIRSLSVAVLIAGGFLVMWAASPAKEQGAPCKESMEECCKKDNDNNTNKMTWETLPHQFFSSL